MIINVVAALILRNDGRVLIARRHPDAAQGGWWEFPGGKIEPTESPEAALARELEEELSVQLRVGPYLASSEHRYPLTGGGEKCIRLHGYLCPWEAQPINLTGSHDRYCWRAPETIRMDTLAPADHPLLTALIARLQSPSQR
ncbi:(deoxy)nucleoside triphosphate pyrophosphohydrolase [Ferrimonas gelatinilytica]|uniref:8-oxo-dGTP diphosphatase n=1 Tax=Ferrimonas gelatinilytica TaxID=1255257 RepID=A0ABP9S790_9GAMM